jgi:hypothetical protein
MFVGAIPERAVVDDLREGPPEERRDDDAPGLRSVSFRGAWNAAMLLTDAVRRELVSGGMAIGAGRALQDMSCNECEY